MGFFSNNNIMSYRRKEMERLERNLQKLAKGEMDIDCEVAPGDDSVRTEREAFIKLNQYILKIKGTIDGLAADVKGVSDNINDGNISYKMDATKYSGIYSNMGKDINAAFEAVEEPMTDINNVLGKMAFNDFTLSMSTNYKGSFAKTASEINDVLKRLLAVQNVAVKISQGDISELENYRKVGKRSENDHLVPALTKMMESIEGLINETTALEKAAIEGNLGARGQADKFKGEYVGIINGINKTLDSVVNPMREVKEAMSQIGVGNLKVSLRGSYSGEYEELINSVNTTTGILNNVVMEISNILTEIAEGNLDISKIREYKGDFGIISESLNKIVNSLNETLGEINTAADQVAAGAEQVSGSSQVLSQGSEEQASSIEEVTASITQMAAQVKQNAVNAGEANQLSNISRENAVKGDEQMRAMLTAMEEINDSSSNISKIIKVIDDIAFQTNMLALNAAVEAARAGQYGKGFAVVAEEVKNLAERSASAAKEVTNMIENSIDKVGKGTRIANDTAKELVEIVKSITKASTLVGEITTASNEQTIAISQINQAVNQVSQVVQTNSATAEESASASEELSSQAEMLKNLVSKFKLKRSIISAGKMEELPPEVMRMLENMYKSKRAAGSFIEDRNGLESPKIKISLNDTEFDKY